MLSTIPIPPIDEQNHIVGFIQEKSEMLDTAIQRAQHQIDLIREYRTRLIADVVIGKVDVRTIPVEAVPEHEALEELVESGEIEEALNAEEAEE